MSVDDFGKLALTFAVVFAIVGIAIQLMRLLDRVTAIADESKNIAKNANRGIELALSDYEKVRNMVAGLGDFVKPLSLVATTANAWLAARQTKRSSKK